MLSSVLSSVFHASVAQSERVPGAKQRGDVDLTLAQQLPVTPILTEDQVILNVPELD